jgi:hypothetical protein
VASGIHSPSSTPHSECGVVRSPVQVENWLVGMVEIEIQDQRTQDLEHRSPKDPMTKWSNIRMLR